MSQETCVNWEMGLQSSFPTMIAWALLSSLLCASTFAADPSGGWLSYARYKAPKPTDVITKLSATMVVSAAVRR